MPKPKKQAKPPKKKAIPAKPMPMHKGPMMPSPLATPPDLYGKKG